MKKDNIYELINNMMTDADEKLESEQWPELTYEETEKIMKKLRERRNPPYRKRFFSYALAAILLVGLLTYGLYFLSQRLTQEKNDNISSGQMAEESLTEQPAEEDTSDQIKDDSSYDARHTDKEQKETTAEEAADDETVILERHDFKVVSSYMTQEEYAIKDESEEDRGLSVVVWNAGGNSDCNFTRVLFSVIGDDIVKLHITIDKCGLYTETPTDIDPEEFLEYRGGDYESKYGIVVSPDKTWTVFAPFGETKSIDIVEVAGNDITVDYSEDMKYGFFIPYELTEELNEKGLLGNVFEWYENEYIVNSLRDAELLVEATYSNGDVITKSYTVNPGWVQYYTMPGTGYQVAEDEFAYDEDAADTFSDINTTESIYGIILKEK